MKALFRSMLAAVALGGSTLAAAGSLQVHLTCPTSVGYGGGDANLTVTATMRNDDYYSSVTLKRYATMLAANTGTGLTSASVFGPFAKTRTTNLVLNPGAEAVTDIVLMKVPNIPGALAYAYVEFITADGHTLGGGGCIVKINP